MKKVLIFADGKVGNRFLELLVSTVSTNNTYTVVYYNKNVIPKDLPSKRFNLLEFDPTSFVKISKIFTREYNNVLIVMSKKMDALSTYNNIRNIKKELQITVLSPSSINLEDPYLEVINSINLMATKMINFLPNHPVIAQNVGIGQGEIMEIGVSSASSYAYRHLANISQKNWRIAAIYRKRKFILAHPSFMIRPNDTLLCIGEPIVLNTVYQRISNEGGQFPLPYGKNLYVFVDMTKQSKKAIKHIITKSIEVQKILNKSQLIIKVINPSVSSNTYLMLKELNSDNIDVRFDFDSKSPSSVIIRDCTINDIGLVIVGNRSFEKYKKILYKTKSAILKLGYNGFDKLKQSVVFIGSDGSSEKLSAVVYDLSVQMSLAIELHSFGEESTELIEHYDNLSKLYGQKVNTIEHKSNPISSLQGSKSFKGNLYFFRFDKNILKPWWMAFFSTSVNRFYFRFKHSHQIFTPTYQGN